MAQSIKEKKDQKLLISNASKERQYAKWCEKADEIIASKPIEAWGVADLRNILKVLKRDGDSIPSRKADMLETYHGWKGRKRRNVDLDLIDRGNKLLI